MYEYAKKDGFPRPRRIGTGYTVWAVSELREYVDAHVTDSLGEPRGKGSRKGKA
ncbi:MAG: hypothetical protein LBQ79_02685 [Deltaproteobacteria bacterium]|nr:hypothetical protein [Deltaproteobacteria bacterium]